ncbi:MAG: SPOR domain-containing protein [Steroidobacteraceae bacterium]
MPRLTTRDYKRPSRSSSPWKLGQFALGVLVGVVLASAGFLIAGAHARHRAAPSSHAGSRSATPAAAAPRNETSSDSAAAAGPESASRTAPANAAVKAPQYDFYRMLPRLNVPVPHEDGRSPQAPPPRTASPPSRSRGGGPSYLLQVGSYRSSAEADQVRARLAHAGISSRVERVTESSGIWNRVRIGPLSDAELAKVREQLRTANIHALVIRAGR